MSAPAKRALAVASGPRSPPTNHETVLAACALVALVAIVFGSSLGYGFVNLDDGQYVTENDVVRRGLTWQGVVWAFTTFRATNWHPLTWLSFMLDVELFGYGPFGHHVTNLLLHGGATLGLFAVLHGATGDRWRSAVVAALFAIHPLHVESVAWVSERKDVLSVALGVATVGAYQRFGVAPSFARYLVVVTAFVLGLLAKPMLVTLPLVLLAWDHWPLGRLSSLAVLGTRVFEKLPLLVLSAAVSLVTLRAQSEVSLEHLSLPFRFAQALHSTGWYLAKALWPSGLAAFYPYDLQLPAWQVALAGSLLLGVTVGVVLSRRPPLVLGWFWYLVTLLPVIGIVQVGAQARADRYTYLPLVGVFIMAAWAVPALATGGVPGRRRFTQGVAGGIAIVVLAYALTARAQVAYWRDARTLMERAVAVTDENWFAHNALGRILTGEGDLAGAEQHVQQALRLAPQHPDVWFNAAILEGELQRWGESARDMRMALQLRTRWPEAHYNLARALHAQGLLDDAAGEYAAALALRPEYADALNNLGSLHLGRGDFEVAERLILEAARVNPDSPFPRVNLAVIYLYRGQLGAAREELQRARELGGRVPPEVERAFVERGLQP